MPYDEAEAKILEQSLLVKVANLRKIIHEADECFRVIHSLIDQTQADLDAKGKKQYDEQGQIKRKPLLAVDPSTLQNYTTPRRNEVWDIIKPKSDDVLAKTG